MNDAPDAAFRRVILQQAGRDRVLRELGRSLVGHEAFRQLESIAKDAFELDADARRPPLGAQDPRPRPERRLVAHVLPVAAPKLGDPIAGRI